jgi:hypothetical protein
MARKLIYNINRFDGGMTSSTRDVTQRDRFAYLSHFDIYRDTGKMYVMPGYVSDNAYSGSATGLKQFRIRAFTAQSNFTIFGLGTKSDGTGTKLLRRLVSDSEWTVPSGALADEGTVLLPRRPFLAFNNPDFYYPAYNSSPRDTYVIRHGGGAGGINATFGLLHAGPQNDDDFGAYVAERGFDGKLYFPKNGERNVASLDGATYTETAKSTALGTYDVQSGNYLLNIVGNINPRAVGLQWDSASLLADQRLDLGSGVCFVAGFPSNIHAYVVSIGPSPQLANGKTTMAVKYANGEVVETRYFIDPETVYNWFIFPIRQSYNDSMTWYARIPTNSAGTEFRQGVWAFGKGTDTANLGVSVLLDTSSLGELTNAYWHGNTLYIAHDTDWSVSRLDNFDTGTYDVTATAETVWYGNETPYQKELNGITIVTNPLPASASVQMYYRTNDSASWTSMGTSSTTGSMKHTFTRVAGVPVGKFQEIQFKFEVLGKVSVQNMFINLTESDDLAY